MRIKLGSSGWTECIFCLETLADHVLNRICICKPQSEIQFQPFCATMLFETTRVCMGVELIKPLFVGWQNQSVSCVTSAYGCKPVYAIVHRNIFRLAGVSRCSPCDYITRVRRHGGMGACFNNDSASTTSMMLEDSPLSMSSTLQNQISYCSWHADYQSIGTMQE